jgi:hypothetical protein
LRNRSIFVYAGITLYGSPRRQEKANQFFYYVVESARVDGKPRIVHQTYLGTAERVAALVKDRTAPIPLAAIALEFGLPGALWLAAQRSGVIDLLLSLWPQPRSGPSTAHYLLLAAMHRICSPGPKTEVADWYRRTLSPSLWGFDPGRFTSQAFWDCFDQIQIGGDQDELDQARMRLLGVWKEKQLVSRRLLAYDTTNFYTCVASTNTRNQLAQCGQPKLREEAADGVDLARRPPLVTDPDQSLERRTGGRIPSVVSAVQTESRITPRLLDALVRSGQML